jgi:exopolyphosphatase/guanosine-5'-triphosphate,3'-diphosphate pyrophosphatase
MKQGVIAAIDMGSNSFHMIIVEIKKDSFKIIEKEREVIRLGIWKEGGEKKIPEEEIIHAISILKKFRLLANTYKARIIAVATSAIRDSSNKKEFIDRIFSATGIIVEVITGTREAELIFSGINKALDIGGKNSLCLDIGGGSTELIYSNSGKIVFAESFKLGAVRLTKKFFPDYVLAKHSVTDCFSYIEDQFRENKNISFNVPFKIAAGSSGTIQNAASIIHYGKTNKLLRKINGFHFSASELMEMTDFVLSCKTTRERLRIGGIEGKRADILPAGLLILNKVFELFNIRELVVSQYALREGIVLSTTQAQ